MPRKRNLIGGRYRVEKTLHRGDNGTVYLARDTKGKSSKRLAVKVFESPANETGNSHRFENRFRTLLNLRHPNLVRVDGVGWDGPSPFVVYEYVQGKDLVEGLRFGGARRFWQATVEILRALSFLHSRDLLHGDLKPSNILVSRSGVKIIDMGLDPAFSSVGRLPAAYTLQYLAPEVIRGEIPGPPADLFSLGITLFQALTNRLPFDGVNAEEVLRSLLEEELPPHTEWADNLPAGSEQIIRKLLEKDPYARFGTARDVILAIIQITGTDFALETEKAQRGYIYGGRMVGRQRESEQLESLAADDSGVRVAWMTGASGIGKSRLAREFNYHCQARGIPFLEGSYPGPAAPAFFPLREVLKEAYDCEDELGANVPPSIARFLGPGEPMPDDMNPGWERFSFYEAVAGAIGGSDPAMPVILHIDNAQFADGSILDLAEYLLRRLPGFRLLVSTDPTISGENGISRRLDRLVRDEGGIILPLEPLRSEDVDSLTRSMLGTSLPPTVALRIAKSTGGNPLLVTEVMRGLAAEGILAYGSEGWSIRLEQSESFDLPRDVGQHFRRKLSSIPEDQREALEMISLFRGPPDAGILESLGILGQATHLSQHGWLRADRGRFAVSPPVLGSLVADQIHPSDRSGYHSRIARVLEKLETDPGEIAYHFLEGGDRKGGATWGRLAASEYGRLSPVDSERTLRKILEILPETDTGARVDLLKSLARSREAQGDLDGAISSYEECCRLKEEGLYEPAERHMDQARVKILERDFEQVERHSREGIRLATRETDPSIRSELFGILGGTMQLQGSMAEARKAYSRSLAEARKGQDPLSEARARHNLGITNLLTGRPKEAVEELERSLQIVEKSRPDRMGMCLSSLADAHLQAGAYSRALPIVLQSLELSTEQGAAQDRVTALYTLGEIHLHLGDVGSARRCWEEGDRLGRLVGDAALAAGDRVQLAGLVRLRSDLSKAVPAARAALRGLKGEADPMDRVHGLRVLAECYLDARLPRRARRVARLALREARLLGSPTAEGVALMVLARVDLLEETSADDARKHLESARSLFAKGGNETYVAFADALIAMTDLKEGDVAGARARLAETDRSPEDRGHPVHQMDFALACA
ncbi:MAG: protein kinase, partial [Planctomycetota bacterium]|nr:protein kinase [Planctomycetota bacterium]